MPPFQIENAVVLQPFTGHNRIAELTVMRAVLSTTIGRGALSLMAKGTSQARPFVKAAHGDRQPRRAARGVLSYLWVYGLIVEFAVMTLLSTTIFALFS
jgi:hypothetical protein